ncbi:sugar-binding domain-containing protein [Flavivirga algicola]|uniref:Beta-galactosidase n=1 Tax=Flavivirga algicola TaxID=2729136 RepID=A0ABX1RTH4_9FLAO|nr:sugar-binding domain-containing protein [Flavivirga algicola]NMH86851.1 hypothetical protein [Flavivirga algicola]
MRIKSISFRLLIIVAIVTVLQSCTKQENNTAINLSGIWSVQLDPENVGAEEQWFLKELSDTISLPGTTDEAGLGGPEKYEDPYNALVRPHYYVGKAWYQRDIEIPENTEVKNYTLFLERVHWVSEVWVNSDYVGSENSLCTAQEYDLTDYLRPGKNRITICVNNKYPFSLGSFASSVSEHTQSNWNGMVGRIELQVKDLIYMDDLRVYPSIADNKAKVRVTVFNKSGKEQAGSIVLQPSLIDGTAKIDATKLDFVVDGDSKVLEVTVPMGTDVKLWNEFTPIFYKMDAILTAGSFRDNLLVKFGMRELAVRDKNFTINGKKTYMRGNLECCIFPLTGYPSMEVESWEEILSRQKELGMNHVRFHSWCPPKAAFEAADKVGVYLQAEAPRANVSADKERDEFIKRELLRINRAYGNHPSFMFMTGGNELAQDDEEDPENIEMIAAAIKDDNRHLYSVSSGGRGMDHKQSRAKVDQYRVGGSRGFRTPGTEEDLSEYYTNNHWASITHEVGQHASYPSVDEIKKYTGVLKPVNLEAIREDLKEKGMLAQAKQFTDATTHHAAILYKEEIEVLMRSRYNAGFQLLSLHDYPGQGTAHVGLFDAFWDNKGGITPAEFRKFCGPTVPLLRMPKRTYYANEPFTASAEITNYSLDDIANASFKWNIKTQTGDVVAEGNFQKQNLVQGERTQLGKIETDLSLVKGAEQLTVTVFSENEKILNDWKIWCYPSEVDMAFPKDILVAHTITGQVTTALENGQNVLLLPKGKDIKAFFSGSAKPVFWSPTWWWTRPRGGDTTMSILCDPEHGLFKHFPTEYHSNWQWWDLQNNSSSIVLDELPKGFKPLVQVIDNYGRNHLLANVLQTKVGKGKLMLCSIDIESDLAKRPAANQLRNAIIEYMSSSDFSPEQTLKMEELNALFK